MMARTIYKSQKPVLGYSQFNIMYMGIQSTLI